MSAHGPETPQKILWNCFDFAMQVDAVPAAMEVMRELAKIAVSDQVQFEPLSEEVRDAINSGYFELNPEAGL